MSVQLRRGNAVVRAVVLLVMVVSLAGIDAARADDKAVPPVTVDLSTRTIGGVLPIDTRFLLVGDVPKTVKKVKVRYRQCPAGGCGGIATDGCTIPVETGEKTLPTVVVGPHPKEEGIGFQFSVDVPRLDANHFYRFIFDESGGLPDSDVTTFRGNARALIERHFADIAKAMDPSSGGKSVDDALAQALPDFRARILDEIDGIKPACSTISAPAGSLLDANTTWAMLQQNHPAFVVPLLSVAQAEENFRRAITDASKGVRPLVQHLSAVANSPLRRMFSLIQVRDATDTVRLLLADHGPAVALTKLSPTDVADVANGADFSSPTSKLTLLVDHSTAEIAARQAAYHKLASTLDDLKVLVRQLNDAGVVEKTLSDAGDRRAVKALIGGDLDAAATDAASLNGLFLSLQIADRDRGAVRASALDSFTAKLVPVVSASVNVAASTLGDFDTFANRYITADAGILLAPSIHKAAPYLGANFYKVAINRNVSLTQVSSFWRRTSLTIGLTAASIADSGSVRRSDLFGSQALVVGLGYRLTDVFRIAGGGVVFNRKDPNPLINRDRLAATPYLSISFDFNLAKSLNGIGKLFGSGSTGG